MVACGSSEPGDGGEEASESAEPTTEAAPSSSDAGTEGEEVAEEAAEAEPAASGIEVLGGADWKAVFAGAPPVELPFSSGGGQGTGMADDYTRKTGAPFDMDGWKYGATNAGGNHKAESQKVIIVENYNLKQDPTTKTVDLWIKSALVTDVKHDGGPEVIPVGTTEALALAGSGTCKMKGGADADFYWRDVYSVGDFSHTLSIAVIAKDAPEEEKKVALSALRQFEYTDKAKPHYKK